MFMHVSPAAVTSSRTHVNHRCKDYGPFLVVRFLLRHERFLISEGAGERIGF